MIPSGPRSKWATRPTRVRPSTFRSRRGRLPRALAQLRPATDGLCACGQAFIGADPKYKDVSALIIKTENKSHVGDSPTGEKGIAMPYRSAMLQTWNKASATTALLSLFLAWPCVQHARPDPPC